MLQNPENITLFPICVLKTALEEPLDSLELEIIKKLSTTTNRHNLVSFESFILEKPELKKLKNFFEQSIDYYIYKILKIPNQISIYITQSWVNYTTKNEQHHIHFHPNSFLSGVFYVDVDPHEDKIIFHKPDQLKFILDVVPEECNAANANAFAMNVQNNQLIIFPSYLVHSTLKKEKSNLRISISFNTFLKGTLGDSKIFTELKL